MGELMELQIIDGIFYVNQKPKEEYLKEKFIYFQKKEEINSYYHILNFLNDIERVIYKK